MNQSFKTILWGSLILILIDGNSQSQSLHKKITVTQPRSLEITYNKTTSVVFPATIKSVDRGSRDLLAQKAKGVENVLQLKAARQEFPETNLTVITVDGCIHEFSVGYVKDPAGLVLHIGDTTSEQSQSLIFQTDMTEYDLKNHASRIVEGKRKLRFVNETNYKVGLSLIGVYIKDDVIFFHFRMKNLSNIDYDVEYFRFYIQDRTKMKRTASQEVTVEPLYIYGNDESIRGTTQQDVVYALEKFTIPDAKYLAIEMFERNGGRNISLHIKNKTIVNAKLVD